MKPEPADNRSVLIVARNDPMRNHLHGLLASFPSITVIGSTDSVPDILEMVYQHKPDLVILDTNISENRVWEILERIKTISSDSIRCIGLVRTWQQRLMMIAAGADAAMLKGFRMSELLAVIEDPLAAAYDGEGAEAIYE